MQLDLDSAPMCHCSLRQFHHKLAEALAATGIAARYRLAR